MDKSMVGLGEKSREGGPGGSAEQARLGAGGQLREAQGASQTALGQEGEVDSRVISGKGHNPVGLANWKSLARGMAQQQAPLNFFVSNHRHSPCGRAWLQGKKSLMCKEWNHYFWSH